jgi:hypothetical protein
MRIGGKFQVGFSSNKKFIPKLGLVMVLVGGKSWVQSWFEGHWSEVPYLIFKFIFFEKMPIQNL